MLHSLSSLSGSCNGKEVLAVGFTSAGTVTLLTEK